MEVISFLGGVQCSGKFISHFSFMASPLHGLTSSKVSFQYGGKQQKSFDILKKNIVIAPILALLYLQ